MARNALHMLTLATLRVPILGVVATLDFVVAAWATAGTSVVVVVAGETAVAVAMAPVGTGSIGGAVELLVPLHLSLPLWPLAPFLGGPLAVPGLLHGLKKPPSLVVPLQELLLLPAFSFSLLLSPFLVVEDDSICSCL